MSETKLEPESLRLRASPKPIVRLNRRFIAVGLGVVAAAAAIALSWGLQRRSFRPVASTEVQIRNIPHADQVNALPKDYASVPRLGPPLGELNAPVVKEERKAGLEVMPAREGFKPDPEEDAARAARLKREREAESAMLSKVVFPLSSPSSRTENAGNTMTPMPSPVSSPASGEPPPNARGDSKTSFVDRHSDGRIYNDASLELPRSPWQLMAGTVIAAALVTGINSDLPGQVIAVVTEPVYDSVSGEALLIPQGARLLGEYDAQVAFGQRRVLLVWTRVVMPDGTSVLLDRTVASDTVGKAGLEDEVDWHWKRLLAGAAVSSILGIGAELVQPESRTGENRIVVAAGQSAQDSINQAGQEITRQNLRLSPTLTIRAGYPVRAVLRRDLVLKPYSGGKEGSHVER